MKKNGAQEIEEAIWRGFEELQALILAQLDEEALCAIIREEIRAAQEAGRREA